MVISLFFLTFAAIKLNCIIMVNWKNYLFLAGLLLLGACSEDSQQGYDEARAQQTLNEMKGVYDGMVMVNNLPQAVQIVIGTDFTVNRLPTEPILSHIFNGGELEAAVNSVETVNFTAATETMAVGDRNISLSMKPGDLLFTAKVGGRDYAVTVTFQTLAYRSTLYDDLSVTMQASELYCDGKAYSLTDNGITYVIDNAKKVKE